LTHTEVWTPIDRAMTNLPEPRFHLEALLFDLHIRQGMCTLVTPLHRDTKTQGHRHEHNEIPRLARM